MDPFAKDPVFHSVQFCDLPMESRQLSEANELLRGWWRYGDEYGCTDDSMDSLFSRMEEYFKKWGVCDTN